MTNMKLLDLFCGAGGAGMGYHRAGFDVTGVDNRPQKRYPFQFIEEDALEYAAQHGHEYDVIHASPPCQFYLNWAKGLHPGNSYIDLVEPTRQVLQALGKPYIIENVMGAPLVNPLMLCGTMFGLLVIRHRIFESNPPIWFAPATCAHVRKTAKQGRRPDWDNNYICVTGHFNDVKFARIAMGIDWMSAAELSQAIPPAYTEWLANCILERLEKQQ